MSLFRDELPKEDIYYPDRFPQEIKEYWPKPMGLKESHSEGVYKTDCHLCRTETPRNIQYCIKCHGFGLCPQCSKPLEWLTYSLKPNPKFKPHYGCKCEFKPVSERLIAIRDEQIKYIRETLTRISGDDWPAKVGEWVKHKYTGIGQVVPREEHKSPGNLGPNHIAVKLLKPYGDHGVTGALKTSLKPLRAKGEFKPGDVVEFATDEGEVWTVRLGGYGKSHHSSPPHWYGTIINDTAAEMINCHWVSTTLDLLKEIPDISLVPPAEALNQEK